MRALHPRDQHQRPEQETRGADQGKTAEPYWQPVFGGYDFMRYFGVEAAYMDGGSPSDHGFSVDLTGWDLAVRGILPIGDRGEVFAKLGWVWWDADFEGFGSDSGDDLLYGVGGGYRLTDRRQPNFDRTFSEVACNAPSIKWRVGFARQLGMTIVRKMPALRICANTVPQALPAMPQSSRCTSP